MQLGGGSGGSLKGKASLYNTTVGPAPLVLAVLAALPGAGNAAQCYAGSLDPAKVRGRIVVSCTHTAAVCSAAEHNGLCSCCWLSCLAVTQGVSKMSGDLSRCHHVMVCAQRTTALADHCTQDDVVDTIARLACFVFPLLDSASSFSLLTASKMHLALHRCATKEATIAQKRGQR